MRGRACSLTEVVCITTCVTQLVTLGFRVEIELEITYITERTSKSAAPSHRSATVVTGLERSKVAKKEKNALSSFRCASDMTDGYKVDNNDTQSPEVVPK